MIDTNATPAMRRSEGVSQAVNAVLNQEMTIRAADAESARRVDAYKANLKSRAAQAAPPHKIILSQAEADEYNEQNPGSYAARIGTAIRIYGDNSNA